MNKVRIANIIGGLLIVVIFIFKLDYSNMSWLNNGHYYGVITAVLFLVFPTSQHGRKKM